MNIKLRISLHNIAKKLLKGWYFCMKPLAYIITKIDNSKYKRKRIKLEQMSLEEVAKLYVKYIVKFMVKRKDPIEKYYCCTKKDGYPEYYEDNFILSDLSRFGYSRFSKTKLNHWYLYSLDYKSIGYSDESKDRWISLENKLRLLVENEFRRVGCNVKYINETEKLDDWFIRQSGYEKTMVVTI